MQIIKLDATDSTNLYLKKLMASHTLEDYTVVTAKKQLKGRGQMGTIWQSEKDKNLTFSVLKKYNDVHITHRFFLNICVSLAIYDSLKYFHVPDIRIKWPNDIMSGSSKICGILIENILNGQNIQASIIGVGLNVNQTEFKGLNGVSSLKLLLGGHFNLEEVLHKILDNLKQYFSLSNEKPWEYFSNSYQRLLFRKDKPSTFKNKSGELFMGFIKGVSPEGKLLVNLEDMVLKEFDLKEIQLLY
ncbi:MAG: biotin--[acetyl-CoA-carboxylase] ligase [Bacteroidota bacterium]